VQDKVFIRQLQVNTIIGVFDFEKQAKQPLFFDVDMLTDFAKAAQSDNVDDVVDYAKVSARIIAHCEATQVELLETLAEQLATIILSEFAVSQIILRISKPQAVLEAQTVGIEIMRKKQS
jgi:dihydroneopterin aldolase